VIHLEETPLATPLAADLRQAHEDGALRFWWLGQAGFAFLSAAGLVLIDPYLSDSLAEKYREAVFKHERMMPVPVPPGEITTCGWYVCTHGHTDHMDPPTIAAVRQAADPLFIIPRAEADKGRQRGIPPGRVSLIDAGETLRLHPRLALTALPSAHEALRTDDAGCHYYLGVVFDFDGLRCYHSGDSVPYPGLAESLKPLAIDAAFLPVNGRDEARRSAGVPGNLTFEEAAALCIAAGIPRLICHHFEMFSFNTVDRRVLQQKLAGVPDDLTCLLPRIGVRYSLHTEASKER
jgi:L-ascorbate metabolism protein UlaG (beta-lactamase superfamily)